ncbi:hypothetical protein [Aureimonas sp. ME7]|uniref:hypothetical protein n=1 Tax=Aureimonas sp. ME7 TaxID=2744252 RepID=UPI0015FB9C15|nr:hypothetical protein [Aureimonas sp. ME7]
MQTYFVVQTYSVNRKRKIEADQPRQVQSEAEALRLGERLSETKFGVIAFSRTGDAKTGDWEDAKILFQFGDFAEEDAEAIRSAA